MPGLAAIEGRWSWAADGIRWRRASHTTQGASAIGCKRNSPAVTRGGGTFQIYVGVTSFASSCSVLREQASRTTSRTATSPLARPKSAKLKILRESEFRQLALCRHSILAPTAEFVILIQHVGQIGNMPGGGSCRKRLMRKPVGQIVIRPRQSARVITGVWMIGTHSRNGQFLFSACQSVKQIRNPSESQLCCESPLAISAVQLLPVMRIQGLPLDLVPVRTGTLKLMPPSEMS